LHLAGTTGKLARAAQNCSRQAGMMKMMQGSKMASVIIIGRWTPKILFSLKTTPYRHGELHRQLEDVSQRMLTRTLRHLESWD
jgi:DNA-binding HxlR family transcriptional regulator